MFTRSRIVLRSITGTPCSPNEFIASPARLSIRFLFPRFESSAVPALRPKEEAEVSEMHKVSATFVKERTPRDKASVALPAASKDEKRFASPAQHLTDDEILSLVNKGKMRFFNLEAELGDHERAIRIRRRIVELKVGRPMGDLPYQNYNYSAVHGQCCENVIGVVPIPVGVAGPLIVDGKEYFVPMATTEGALVASTTRGCKAISLSGGARTSILNDGMTRAPVLSVPSIEVGQAVINFIKHEFEAVAKAFDSTSRFARLTAIKPFLVGRKLYLRFRCVTGDAMGMNMTGKGTEKAVAFITDHFPGVSVLSLSGNVCTDKKPSAVNWIEGRGKSVAVEAVIKADVVHSVLKTTVPALVELNYAKNLLGSAVAGSIGGVNAHASNVVTACFLATGQDPAQNVESSNCITTLEATDDGDLYVSVTMPSLEVGTVGGGTSLPGQSAMLSLLGVKGAHSTTAGANAQQLARVIASTVMAGELSLMSALSSGHLISSHLKLNRKPGGAPAH